ncbi:hypothetical protein LTS18_004344 [Coniosporium uncinatum]|uniref:Uncharacterized protein n=1 Tax=Coniosporium uncinatum TaxID=93489 RepID=A0ACC3D6E1_9PEZI|nr:hypothetical protein LTS18_004344 [Coniosporium uncinatum]
MADKHMSHDEFFAGLTKLFETTRSKSHGSVFLVQKRLSYGLSASSSTPTSPTPQKVADDPLWDLHPPSPLPVLIRATAGKSKNHPKEKVKLSTVVQPDALEAFFARFAEVARGGMTGLKKRDRTRRKAKDRKRKKAGGKEGVKG